MQNAVLVAVVCFSAGAAAFSAPAPDPKGRIRDIFSGRIDSCLACPATKLPLRKEVTVVGGQMRQSLVSSGATQYSLVRYARCCSNSDLARFFFFLLTIYLVPMGSCATLPLAT